jgi:HAD superfamily hydrolase (TIGR01509 family)
MKAVIFDCDGVLVETEAIYQEAQHKFLDDLGIIYQPYDYVENFMGLPESSQMPMMKSLYGDVFPKDYRQKVIQYCHEQMDIGIELVTGAEDFIKDLRIPFSVASSSDKNLLDHKMRVVGLHPFFAPHIYSTDLVSRGKPFPDLFLHAAQGMNINPADITVVEDSPNGVKAALAAGMKVIGLGAARHCGGRHQEIMRATGAHDYASSYKELKAILA